MRIFNRLIHGIGRGGVALLCVLVGLGGCVNLGPRAMQAGRADWNAVLHDTTDEQLLANLVRLRYRDRPYFLEVTAVTTQYSFIPRASAVASFGSGDVDTEGNIGAGIEYSEVPTISYIPLQGDDFARRLLTPVSLEALLLLGNSGWSVDRLLRLCVQRINGVPNAVTASGPTPDMAPEYSDFHRVTRRLRELQLSGDLSLGFIQEEQIVPVMRFSDKAKASDAYVELVDLLNLTPGQPYYRVSLAIDGAGPDTITFQTRSLNGILYYLSHGVVVPEAHQGAGLVTLTQRDDGTAFDWSGMMASLFNIRVADRSPETAAVRVPYRGHWYYIADNDLSSKSTFSLLAQLFALQAGSGEGMSPVLTIPVGR